MRCTNNKESRSLLPDEVQRERNFMNMLNYIAALLTNNSSVKALWCVASMAVFSWHE